MIFSDNLSCLRRDRMLTRKEVAGKIGVSTSAYTNYENGNREPDFSTTIKLADFFGVSIDYLITGKHPAERELFYTQKEINIIQNEFINKLTVQISEILINMT